MFFPLNSRPSLVRVDPAPSNQLYVEVCAPHAGTSVAGRGQACHIRFTGGWAPWNHSSHSAYRGMAKRAAVLPGFQYAKQLFSSPNYTFSLEGEKTVSWSGCVDMRSQYLFAGTGTRGLGSQKDWST